MKMALSGVLAGSLALSGCISAAAGGRVDKGEMRLAKLLAGRVAGKPRSCISAWRDSRLEVIEKTALVYDDGRTIYVARPLQPKMLDGADILVLERTGSELCKQDVIRTIDRTSGYMTGSVFLGDFVPYTVEKLGRDTQAPGEACERESC